MTSCECGNIFQQSTKMRVNLAYCKPCRKKRSADLVEFISSPSAFIAYSDAQLDMVETLLRCLTADIRVDLHKTLDTLPVDVLLSGNSSACCISYVGQLTETRLEAREDIQARIESGQIEFGLLVFKRGSRRDPDAANRFTAPGSKAWVNALLMSDGDPMFVDDAVDHVESVNHVGVTSYLLTSGQNLLRIIDDHFEATSTGESSDDLFER